jgi:predicted outer membrane repeat protein
MVRMPSGGYFMAGWAIEDLEVSSLNSGAVIYRANEDADIPDCTIPDDLHEAIPEPPYLWTDIDDVPTSGITGNQESNGFYPFFPDIRDFCHTCVQHVNQIAPFTPFPGTDTSWDNAYKNISDAISAPLPPDANGKYCEVWVAQALDPIANPMAYYVYDTSVHDTIQMKSGIHVYGGFEGDGGPTGYGWETSRDQRNWIVNETVIDGRDPALPHANKVYHVVTGIYWSTIDGFTIRYGRANGSSPLDKVGGGMLNYPQASHVENNLFLNNGAVNWGGAICNIGTLSRIENCYFVDNRTYSVSGVTGGGAIANIGAAAAVKGCDFTGNKALYGGAVYNFLWNTFPIVEASSYEDCYFGNNQSWKSGGAVLNYNTFTRIENSTFYENNAYRNGGAMFNMQTTDWEGMPEVLSCTFEGNSAKYYGGAVYTDVGSAVSTEYFYMENCLLYENETVNVEGGAIANVSYGTNSWFNNCTLANNFSGGIFMKGSAPVLVGNSILWDNGSYEFEPACDETGGPLVEYSDVMYSDPTSECPGVGNINVDPDFVDISTANFHLLIDSECIDVADPWSAATHDIDGNLRDPDPDMGAYEYIP